MTRIRRLRRGLRKELRRRSEALRLRAAQRLLPPSHYLQVYPNRFRQGGQLHDLPEDIRAYNNDHRQGFKGVRFDGNRVVMLRLLLDHAATLSEGHFAELGTWRGYSATLLFRYLPQGCQLHCFDTFEGFTNSDLTTDLAITGIQHKAGHFSDTSIDGVRGAILGDRPDDGRLVLHRGFFPTTFEGLEDHRWRLVHLDADLYAPMRAALERFWPTLVPDGVLLMHDYDTPRYTGVRKASCEFFTPRGITPVPMMDKAGTAVVIKPSTAKTQ